MNKLLSILLLVPSIALASPLQDIKDLDTPCKHKVLRLLIKHGYITKEQAVQLL